MSANYVLLETVTVGESGASSISFNNIPQSGYTDLKIVCSGRVADTGSQANMLITFNGSTTAYYDKALYGNGSSASSFSDSNQASMAAAYVNTSGSTANTFNNYEVYIPNYTSSNYKSFSVDSVVENNATTIMAATLGAGLWQNTAAITSVSFAGGSNWKQYSTFSLYGLAAVGTTPVIAPYASGGDIIQTDGTYWYHAFLSSGTFTPAKTLSCDYLVVAGGGGGSGGYPSGGGGGAGGLRSTVTATGGGGSLESVLALAANTGYTVTVGAGGASINSKTTQATSGSNSVFATITSIGGGGGAASDGSLAGLSGGSGGGGGSTGSTNSAGGAGTTNQGYAGSAGTGVVGVKSVGGGGGGAGATTSNQNGGAGLQLTAFATPTGTGVSGYYAGGGGGTADAGISPGTGGSGGGGAGTYNSTSPNAGTPNTGSGGGAGGLNSSPTNYYGGKGGSGIVIVRYAV